MLDWVPEWVWRLLDVFAGLEVLLPLVILGLIVCLLIFFPRTVVGLFAGRSVKRITVGLTGVSVELAAEKVMRANEIWRLPSPEAVEVQARLASLVRIPKVLWVYDDPESVENEIDALRLLGFDVRVVRTNDEAVQDYRRRYVDVVVSDIDREAEGEEAGLDLMHRLEEIRAPAPPIVYYVGRVDHPVTEHGHPVCNEPLRLFSHIGDMLEGWTG